jgi:hypothetical protein
MAGAKTKQNGFNRTLALLGALGSGLSVFALVAHAWEQGLAAPVAVIVGFYNACLSVALGWAEPPLRAFADALSAWTGFNFHLYPHWKTSIVAYGILGTAGLSAWLEHELGLPASWWTRGLSGFAGVLLGVVDAMLQRDLEPGQLFYGLSQVFGASYLLVVVFGVAALMFIAGSLFRNTRGFETEVMATAGARMLTIFAGALAWLLTNAGSNLVGL